MPSLNDILPMISADGRTLAGPEVHQIQAGLDLLAHEAELTMVKFWGKISGEGGDYYIAQSATPQNLDFLAFTYYVIGADGKFSALPTPTGENLEVVVGVQGPFTGVATTQLREPLEGEEEYAGPTELDRVAYVVSQINNACAVVPSNSFTIKQEQWIASPSFAGLNASNKNPLSLSSYEHFRKPTGLAQAEIAVSDDAQYLANKLDPLNGNEWAIRETSAAKAVLRNLKYPGFVSFHDPASNVFGNCYLGNGQANFDHFFR